VHRVQPVRGRRRGLLSLGFVVSAAGAACTTPRTSESHAGCPEGAARDAQGICVCRPDRSLMLGTCAPPTRGACALNAGHAGGCEHTDSVTCACADLRAVAEKLGIRLEERQTLGCREGQSLVVARGLAHCEAREPDAAVATRACPPGQVELASGCTPFVAPAAAGGYTVDVAAWARASFGPNEARGEGQAPKSSPFCAA
jgi:hypothetical protein